MAPAAALLINYSRSGGTMISRVLGSIKNTILISEVHPNLDLMGSVAEQAKKWYNIDITIEAYQNMVVELYTKSVSLNKRLIIRDFSFLDFTPNLYNKNAPSGTFSALKLLENKIPLIPFAFVRDAYDVWISRNFPPYFSEYYLKYIEALVERNIPIFKYEDFCKNPTQELFKISKLIGVTHDENAIDQFINYTNITGDNLLKSPSRGGRLEKIELLPRKKIPAFLMKKSKNDFYLQKANEILGYPIYIDDSRIEFEKNPSNFVLESKWFYKKWSNKYPTDFY